MPFFHRRDRSGEVRSPEPTGGQGVSEWLSRGIRIVVKGHRRCSFHSPPNHWHGCMSEFPTRWEIFFNGLGIRSRYRNADEIYALAMKGEAVWLWKWLRRGKKTGNVSSRTCHVTAGTARFGMRRFGVDNGGRRKGNRRGGSLRRQRGEGMARVLSPRKERGREKTVRQYQRMALE